MTPWKLIYTKFDPEQESLREALTTLGNGYFGTRGASPETAATKVHYPGTYIAGVYNTLPTEIANRTVHNEDFVNCPNWLMVNVRVNGGPWFDRLKTKILAWRKELDMRKGVLKRKIRWQDDQGRITTIESRQIVSMAHPHCAALQYSVTPENYDGEITIRCGIDGLIINSGVDRYKQLNSKHLEPCAHGTFGKDGVYLQMQTNQSKIRITEAQRTLVYHQGQRVHPKVQVLTHGRQRIIQEMTLTVSQKEKVTIEKLVSIYTSRDHGVADSCHVAQETVSHVENFQHLYRAHKAKWKALWKRFDIELEGDDFIQRVLRLHTFHLLQVASTYNEEIDAGMPARGLHGEAYRGHIFWDELYIFPFYNLHSPEITRALLMYRYRRLEAAKENAKEHGFRGAMYPWQSASTGEETSQEIHLNPLSGTWGPDYSSLQRHVSISVAYNVWNYFYTSGDRDFLDRYGAEMILEIAYFWSSITEKNPDTGRYEISGVMGPDEFHEKYPGANKGGFRNNAYTNVMAVWVIQKALQIIDDMLEEEDKIALLVKAGITDDEINRWREIEKKMTVVIDTKGLIHQFEGYMDLKELDWDEYRRKYENIHRVDRILKSEGLSPDSYKVAKQADVLMLFYVLNFDELKEILSRLGYSLTKGMVKKNFDYYLARTSHGSTLSMVVHAYLAFGLDMGEKAFEYYMHALKSDIYDTQGGTTQEGIHAGVMGSTLDLFLRTFAGLAIYEDRIKLVPRMPEGWKRIRFNIRYKNIWFHIHLTESWIEIEAEPVHQNSLVSTAEIPVTVHQQTHKLLAGKTYRIPLSEK